MTLPTKRLVAAFFLTNEPDAVPLSTLLQQVDASDIVEAPTVPANQSGLVDCRWAGLSCQAYLSELFHHRILQIYFWQSSFLDMFPDDQGSNLLEADSALPLALAFKRACEALSPQVAFIAAHLDQAQQEQVLDKAGLIEARAIDRLVDEHFGLLYLDDEMRHYITTPPQGERERLPIAQGCLLFSGCGNSRWF